MSRKKYLELVNKLDFLVNNFYSLTGKLRAIELDLAAVKRKLDLLYNDQCSDWADDSRRTGVMPLSGNQHRGSIEDVLSSLRNGNDFELTESHFRELLETDEKLK